MAARWTDAQLDAIRARRGTVLVSAAAGSGKTAVLVERVIERLTDDEKSTDADRLLVVTFTKAAAADTRPDFLAKRRSKGTKTTRAWPIQSWIYSTISSAPQPRAAILAPWTTAQP